MLYLIGGSPRTGKTTLAKRVLRKHPMVCIPTDAIHGTLAEVEAECGWDDELPRVKAAQQFQPVLFGLAGILNRNWDDAMIEGATVLPRQVAQLRKRGIPVTAVFLGWSTADLKTILQYGRANNWFLRQTSEVQQRGVKDIEKFSRHGERQCLRYELPYIDMAAGTYRMQHALALKILTAEVVSE